MILAAIMAIFSPDSYKLISEEKLAVIIILGAYITLWAWLFAAYLQRSQITDNNKSEESANTTTSTPKEVIIDLLSEEDSTDLHSKNDIQDVW